METPSECEECGYDVSAVPGDRCPECGSAFDRAAPFARRPWPATWRIALRMCGPAAALCTITFGLAMVEFGRDLMAIAWVLGIGVWLVVVLAPPLEVAARVAAECEVRPRRPALRVRLTSAGVAANVLMMVGSVRLIVHLLF